MYLNIGKNNKKETYQHHLAAAFQLPLSFNIENEVFERKHTYPQNIW